MSREPTSDSEYSQSSRLAAQSSLRRRSSRRLDLQNAGVYGSVAESTGPSSAQEPYTTADMQSAPAGPSAQATSSAHSGFLHPVARTADVIVIQDSDSSPEQAPRQSSLSLASADTGA